MLDAQRRFELSELEAGEGVELDRLLTWKANQRNCSSVVKKTAGITKLRTARRSCGNILKRGEQGSYTPRIDRTCMFRVFRVGLRLLDCCLTRVC